MAYGKIEVFEEGVCEVDLFVQDQEGSRITDGWVERVEGRAAAWLGGAVGSVGALGAQCEAGFIPTS